MQERQRLLNMFYTDSCQEEERLNSRHGSIEFLTTTKFLEGYLAPGCKILEIGAGTGKYSLFYAGQGYDVTAVEYVEHNLEILTSKIKTDMKIKAMQGDAVDLFRFADDMFDVTLVLGPLYHLYEREDQENAVREAIRVTKPDGILAIAYLASDSIMIDWALKDHHLLDGYGKDFDENFKMINYPGGIFAAFYINEFKEMMGRFPVRMEHNIATDGMASHVKEEIDSLSEEEFAMWLRYHFSTCEREELQGYSNHLLYICRKIQK